LNHHARRYVETAAQAAPGPRTPPTVMARPPPTDQTLGVVAREYPFEDLQRATGGFAPQNQLGEGSYGAVFRGELRDGTEVAIKVLQRPKESGFHEEVKVLSKSRHPNLVILMGFARGRTERYLVYELMEGGDVCGLIMKKEKPFLWHQRLTVAEGTALGLSSLHSSTPAIFHRDIKTQNILLDANMTTAKLADFGLALLAEGLITRVEQTSGTAGYADPNYIETARISEKTEVYSLGMVLLELLAGKPPALLHPNGHLEYTFRHIAGEPGRAVAMQDPHAGWPGDVAMVLATLAVKCINPVEHSRPSTRDVVTELRTLRKHGQALLAQQQHQQHQHQQAQPNPFQSRNPFEPHYAAGAQPQPQPHYVAAAQPQPDHAAGPGMQPNYAAVAPGQPPAGHPQAGYPVNAGYPPTNLQHVAPPTNVAAAAHVFGHGYGPDQGAARPDAAVDRPQPAAGLAGYGPGGPFPGQGRPGGGGQFPVDGRSGAVQGFDDELRHLSRGQGEAGGNDGGAWNLNDFIPQWFQSQAPGNSPAQPQQQQPQPQKPQPQPQPQPQQTAVPRNVEGIQQLTQMGFTEAQAEQAFRRCSTVEGAAEWLLNNS